MKKKTALDFVAMKSSSEKISLITAYDYSMARLVGKTNIDAILVGDSLGMVYAGEESTLPVTVEQMIYHTKAVKKGAPDKFIITDMPFLSYQVSLERAIENAGLLMKDTGANAVKLEGGEEFAESIYQITSCGIPVCGHLGMTPQSVHAFGGFKFQGDSEKTAEKIVDDAKILQEAGAFAIVLELVPEELARKISETLSIPTIGIGAGRFTDGQVLVINDVLGLDERFKRKIVKEYADLATIVTNAVSTYSDEIKKGAFPSSENVVK